MKHIKSNVITDKRTLNALAKAGHISRPDVRFSYVDRSDELTSTFDHKGNKYSVKYFDGCFYPFVVKLNR